jgi:hypothetical protein
MTASDEWLSPQVAVLSPAASLRIAGAIVAEEAPYGQSIAAGHAALEIVKEAVAAEKLLLSRKEHQWLDRVASALDELPAEETSLIAALEEQYGSPYDKESYGL